MVKKTGPVFKQQIFCGASHYAQSIAYA